MADHDAIGVTQDTADKMKDAAVHAGEQAARTAGDAAEKAGEKTARGFEAVAHFGQENVDAMIRSSDIVAKTAGRLNAEVVDYSKKSFEQTAAAARAIATARTVTEMMEKQADFARTSFDGFFRQAVRMNEMLADATREAYAPWNDRVSAAAGMIKPHQG